MLDRVRFIEDEDVTRCSLISYKKKKRNSLLIFTFFTLFSSSCFLHMFSANSLGIYFQKTVTSPYDLYFIVNNPRIHITSMRVSAPNSFLHWSISLHICFDFSISNFLAFKNLQNTKIELAF